MNKDQNMNTQSIIETEGNWKSLGLYFALTFIWTWAFMIPAVNSAPEQYRTPLIIVAAFGPFLAALVTKRIFEGKDKLRRWLKSIFRFKIPVSLYLTGAFIIPLLIGLLQFILYRVLGGTPGFQDAQPWFLYLFSLIPTA